MWYSHCTFDYGTLEKKNPERRTRKRCWSEKEQEMRKVVLLAHIRRELQGSGMLKF